MREPEMKIVGDLICETLANGADREKLAEIKEKTSRLCSRFPMFAMEKATV
jgi:glycine/serine hydroxymethyltransferase